MLVSFKWCGRVKKARGRIQIKLFERNWLFSLAVFEAELDYRKKQRIAACTNHRICNQAMYNESDPKIASIITHKWSSAWTLAY